MRYQNYDQKQLGILDELISLWELAKLCEIPLVAVLKDYSLLFKTRM